MQIQLEGNLTAPRRAREFVHEHWQSVSADYVAATEADVTLVASELVTNAVQAGAREITVQIRAAGAWVELRVSDDAEGWPIQKRSDHDDVRGRGLFITAQLAAQWSATEHPAGKTVTAAWARKTR